MLRLFRHNTLARVAVIVATALLLWGRAFVQPVPMAATTHFAPLYELLYGWLHELPRLASGLALLLVLLEAVWLNLMMHNHKIGQSGSLLPTLLFVLGMSWDSASLTLTPMVLGSLFVLGAVSQLLSDGSLLLSTGRNFGAACCVGLAAMCLLPMLVYLLPLALVFFVYKMYRWRHWIVGLLGLLAPWIALLLYGYLSGSLEAWLTRMGDDLVTVGLRYELKPVGALLHGLLFDVLLLAGLMHLLGMGGDNVAYMRINTRVLSLPLLAAVLLVPYTALLPFDPQAAAVPFVFLGDLMLRTKRKRAWINETLFWIVYVGALL